MEKVPIGTPDTWCQRMMIVGKSNGEPRRVIDFQPLNALDFQPLNAHATRETHHTKSPYYQARNIPREMKKSVFDAWNGYRSIASRGHPFHHIRHCLGKIPLPHRPPGVQGFRQRIHCQIRQSGRRHEEQNKVHRRHSDMVCGHRASIQRRCPLANEMWHQWYHPQPGQISICIRHSAIRW